MDAELEAAAVVLLLVAVELTEDADAAGRPVEAVALETGPWLVAMISGA